MAKNRYYDDDDGRVIADMGDVDRQPMLIPRFNRQRRDGDDYAGIDPGRSRRSDMERPPERNQTEHVQPEYVPPETRRAMIGGAVTAGLLIAIVFAVVFGGLIYLIGHW